MPLIVAKTRFSYCCLCALGPSEVIPNLSCGKLLHKEFDKEERCEGEIVYDLLRENILICNDCRKSIPMVLEKKICGKFIEGVFSGKKDI